MRQLSSSIKFPAIIVKRLLVSKVTPGKEVGHPVYIEKTCWDVLKDFLIAVFIYSIVFGTGFLAGYWWQ